MVKPGGVTYRATQAGATAQKGRSADQTYPELPSLCLPNTYWDERKILLSIFLVEKSGNVHKENVLKDEKF
jgi:hypothetical protein